MSIIRRIAARVGQFWDACADWTRARRSALVPLDFLLRWSTLLCIVALGITIAGKLSWFSVPANAKYGLNAKLTVYLLDVAFFLLVAAAIVLVERKWPKLAFATVPLVLLLLSASVINYFWLTSTGDQLALSVILVGLANPESNLTVAVEEVNPKTLISAGTYAVIGLACWGALTWPIKRRLRSAALKPVWLTSAILAGLGLLALVGSLTVGRSREPQIRAMSKNVQINLIVASAKQLTSSVFTGERHIDQQKVYVERAEKTGLYNVVLLLLESANYVRSSFGDPKANRTPFLVELSRQGLFASNMRAVIPHSSKSLFTVHCGIYPDMRRKIIEHSEAFPRNCLPDVLRQAGYATAYFQSANGGFESRPRMVHNMGFKQYFAREVLGAELTAYVNGDDWAIMDPAFKWAVEQNRKGPFMLSIFTSLQHVSYEFPARYHKPKCAGEDKKACVERRFGEMYELVVDPFVRDFFRRLEETGLAENTIVVVSGDHGEAFGEHGLYIHDNVYYEEGLRVPTIVWSKKLIKPGTVNDEPRSLIDIYPTVLSLLKIPYDPSTVSGVPLTEKQPPDTKRYFRCWYDDYCQGYVQGDNKVVAVPKDNTYFRFDLKNDPLEQNPFVEEEYLARDIEELDTWMESHRKLADGVWKPRQLYEIWSCKDTKGGKCKLDSDAYTRQSMKGLDAGEQSGLLGSYFKTQDFAGESQQRLDPIVNFYWQGVGPLPGYPSKNFSIRWEGCIRIEQGENYYLAGGSDDGMIIYVDGKRVVVNDGRHMFRWKTSTHPLAPGTHKIRIDYDQIRGEAVAALGWITTKARDAYPEIIPPERLIPPQGNSRFRCEDTANPAAAAGKPPAPSKRSPTAR